MTDFASVEWGGWFTVGVIVLMMVALAKNAAPPEMILALALSAVTSAGVITVRESVAGFSNTGVLTVAILYVVAAGLNGTGTLEYLVGKLLGTPRTLAGAQLRIFGPVALLSAFLNNTPVVAMMIPVISKWAGRIKVPVSQLLMPLSFVAILGGTCTLIGTSTNLVVAGKYASEFPEFGPLTLFGISLPGIPSLLLGLTYMLLFSAKLLPDSSEIGRRSQYSSLLTSDGHNSGEFMVACKVGQGSRASGLTIQEAGLRGIRGLFLSSIEREGTSYPAIGHDFVIRSGDVLLFVGVVPDDFMEFCASFGFVALASPAVDTDSGQEEDPSFILPTILEDEVEECKRIVHAMVKDGSALVGKTARDADFRARYGAAILSLARHGEGVTHSNIGRIPLAVGDVLLLLVGDSFSWNTQATRNDLKALPNSGQSVGSSQGSSWEFQGLQEDPLYSTETGLNREFLISMRVAPSSRLFGAQSLVGRTVQEGGLRGLPGVFLIAIQHATGSVQYVVGPEERLAAGDVLWFVGTRESLAIVRRVPGLCSVDDQEKKLVVDKLRRRLIECAISLHSNLRGKTVREARFRTRYDAVVVAVHRHGTRLISKIGDIELHAGDVLVLETGPTFVERFSTDPNFTLISEIEDSTPPRFNKFWIAAAAAVFMIVLPLVWEEHFHLLNTAVYASAVMIGSGCLTTTDARNSVGWDVIVTVACAFGLSTALQKTNVAAFMGQGLAQLASLTNAGFWGVLLSTYVATAGLSLIVANNAAALLMFPIAALAAKESCPEGSSEERCLEQQMYILMLGASACFASPYGYQTNMMVMGPGHYTFVDFVKFGGVMQLWQIATDVTFVFFMDFWYVNWLVASLLFGVVAAILVRPRCFQQQQTSTILHDSHPAPTSGIVELQ